MSEELFYLLDVFLSFLAEILDHLVVYGDNLCVGKFNSRWYFGLLFCEV